MLDRAPWLPCQDSERAKRKTKVEVFAFDCALMALAKSAGGEKALLLCYTDICSISWLFSTASAYQQKGYICLMQAIAMQASIVTQINIAVKLKSAKANRSACKCALAGALHRCINRISEKMAIHRCIP